MPAVKGKAPEIQIDFAKGISQYPPVSPSTSEKLESNPTEIQSPPSHAIPIQLHNGIVLAPLSSEDKMGGFRLSVGRARSDINLEKVSDVDALAPFDSENILGEKRGP